MAYFTRGDWCNLCILVFELDCYRFLCFIAITVKVDGR